MRIWLWILVVFAANTAHAQLTIEITKGIDDPTPIAISPFSWEGQGVLSENISDIVETDLGRSGMFDLMPRENMLSRPDRPQNVFFRDWRALGRDYLLIGRIIPVPNDANKIKVTYHLYDIIRQKVLLTTNLTASKTALRKLAHRISDQVFEKLTNIPGAFSTRMFYITSSLDAVEDRVYRLWVADADGERARVVLESDEPIVSPAWSPDGRQVAYVSFESGKPAIYRQVLASGEREKLTDFKGLNSSPAWSPDGRKLAFVLSKDGSPDIYVMDLATKNVRKIGSHRFAIDTEPQWMPDGQSIIFTSNRGGQPQIYQVDLTSSSVKRLTFDGTYNARARPMPDGSGIILVHRNHGQFHIARMDLDRSKIYVLTDTYLDESPSIAANGSMVMYATKRNDRGILAAVSIDGRIKFLLPSADGDVREPAWSPFLN
ncbi:Protein TolB [BD1-7 clade bacterium]|uniref:Tol-Pal system protein TolB n=1 Tax=BD1-7 clade bacterium TaxID=2029982 RepID=A0A5S9MSN5_9GAMM|nr:Protein TolB [BD1-7 clade bacterium]CAA0081522.1 Protein TolB [BD1-7 clade bacterium]